MSETSEKLRHIIKHAYTNAAAVKEIMDRAGVSPDDVRTVSDLDRIPVTSKDRLAELQAANPPFGGFLAVPFGRLRHVFFSPGPLYEPSAGESEAASTIQEMFAIAGFGAGDDRRYAVAAARDTQAVQGVGHTGGIHFFKLFND